MGKFDPSILRYLSKDDIRVLVAIEMGMRNHDLVPVELIDSIAKLKHGGAQRCIQNCLRSKLIRHDKKKYDGYSLNVQGYDMLALHTLVKRGVIKAVGRQIGVGKESDVFMALTPEGEEVVLKLNRLGRTSFRTVKKNRDYHKHRSHCSWLYLSRLSAMKEFAFMKVLYDHGFPVPTPMDTNRHAVIMSKAPGLLLNNVTGIDRPGKVFATIMDTMVRLAECGLVHCDFNEFNIIVAEDGQITLIDFPQMVSTQHPNASELFQRDVSEVAAFFSRKFGFVAKHLPTLVDDVERKENLDSAVAASGFDADAQKHLEEGQRLFGCSSAIDAEDDEGSEQSDEEAEHSGEDIGEKHECASEDEDVQNGEESNEGSSSDLRGAPREPKALTGIKDLRINKLHAKEKKDFTKGSRNRVKNRDRRAAKQAASDW